MLRYTWTAEVPAIHRAAKPPEAVAPIMIAPAVLLPFAVASIAPMMQIKSESKPPLKAHQMTFALLTYKASPSYRCGLRQLAGRSAAARAVAPGDGEHPPGLDPGRLQWFRRGVSRPAGGSVGFRRPGSRCDLTVGGLPRPGDADDPAGGDGGERRFRVRDFHGRALAAHGPVRAASSAARGLPVESGPSFSVRRSRRGVFAAWQGTFFVGMSRSGEVSWGLLAFLVAGAALLSLVIGLAGGVNVLRRAPAWRPAGD